MLIDNWTKNNNTIQSLKDDIFRDFVKYFTGHQCSKFHEQSII